MPSKETWPPVTPILTVDAVIRIERGIVLIKRKNFPYGWALPGGFVEVGETVENAVRREALEETGLSLENLWLVGVYSDPTRDPRFHTVGVVFGATAHGEPCGGDDAADACLIDDSDIPDEFAFDHGKIITDFLRLEKFAETRSYEE